MVKVSDRRVVICESFVTPHVFRQALVDVLFTHYQVLSVALCPIPVLALLALGSENALVVDSGFDETSVIAVSEGVPISRSFVSVPLATAAFHKYDRVYMRLVLSLSVLLYLSIGF